MNTDKYVILCKNKNGMPFEDGNNLCYDDHGRNPFCGNLENAKRLQEEMSKFHTHVEYSIYKLVAA